ncbi:SAM binding domain-containing protein containing protein [Ceratocystis lukuohia]|uniref:Methyltransferase domain-containing protein n=2 Tax=Ceratocystis TaxID=5157 RepID=A0A2C5XEF1_9PEZI|nr:hypothetical protein CFIMG_007629RA00001 [Ceratocystis fimbriata CBS 114723]
MLTDFDAASKLPKLGATFTRANSVSVSASSSSLVSKTRTMSSSGQHSASASSEALLSKPFVLKNSRTYINDVTLPYPLPVDLTELHRQSLRTLMLIQLFRVPVCCPNLTTKPPTRVLEVGCGSGFWSMMCHRYFRNRGHNSVSFTGIDISPLSLSSTSGLRRPDQDMKWRFIQHDIRITPFPFPNEEFDLIMVKDLSLAITNDMQQKLMDEYIRLLSPGGILEVWESDHTIRMLRPPPPIASGSSPPATAAPGAGSISGSTATTLAEEEADRASAITMGAYVMSPNTALSAALNKFLAEYNTWLTRALELRDICPVPCTLVGPMLLQESDSLTDVRSCRLVVPFSDVRWEKEGIGGVQNCGGANNSHSHSHSHSSSKHRSKSRHHSGKTFSGLSPGQMALRRTALMTVIQEIQALESVLREVNGKSQDEWDTWMGKMMHDLLQENGTSWGECLEIGAWWARKR